MGDRAQICIKMMGDKGKVYLYTHWQGTELLATLKRALARRERWGDPEYLARIIFCEMVKGSEGSPTGFGIGTYPHTDVSYPIPVLDCINAEITWEGPRGASMLPQSFDHFIGE
jgi:hypothetical protein